MTNLIYHYSSVAGLYGVINSKGIWLTSLNSTNDKSELKEIKEIVDSALINLKITNKIPQDLNLDISYFDKNIFYSASFVKYSDSLTHWERYGNLCKGICIVFDASKFKHLPNSRSNDYISSNVMDYADIVYEKSEQIKIAEEHILQNISFLMNGFKSYDDIPNDAMTRFISNSIMRIAPMFKHKGFSNEEEFRIFYNEKVAEDMTDGIIQLERINGHKPTNHLLVYKKYLSELQHDIGSRKHQLFSDQIRSYYELSLRDIWGSDLIQEIIIGPRCTQSIEELRNFLDSNYLSKTKISISTIPIR